MLQKIKYPVGSKLKNDLEEGIIEEVTPNGFACILNINDLKWNWLSQEGLDHFGWKLVSSPTRWKPEEGELYYFIGINSEIRFSNWMGSNNEIFNLKRDNVFKTEGEAYKKIDEINSREI